MRIAILSDIHDNLWDLAAALETVESADALICCGDLCSPFVVDVLARFTKEIHVVFGNNDADLYRIAAKASKLPRFHLHGEFFEREFDGKRFAVNHFDYIAKPLAASGKYDVVCFGHNHEHEIGWGGKCLLINPGPIMGAKFSSGKWEDVPPTFVIYDSLADSTETFERNAQTFTKRDKHSRAS
jgi:putative phosphoesterase